MQSRQLALFIASLAACGVAAADDTPIYQGGEMIVTASRFDQTQQEVPANVAVITARDIQNSSATSLPEVIAQYAGVHLFSTNGTTSGATLDLRGFGMTATQNTLVLVNGQRADNLDLSAPSWSSIPLSAIARIEVVRGSGAVLYGAGASGGVVNIITKNPAATDSGSVTATFGSERTRDLQVQGNLAGQGTRLRINAEDYGSDHYRNNNQERLKNLDGDLRMATGNGDVYVNFGADHQDLRLPGDRQVNPGKGIDQFDADPTGTATPKDYSTRADGRLRLGTTQQTTLGEVAGELSYRDKETSSYFDNSGSPSCLESNLGVWSLTPRLKHPYNVLGHAATLVTGIDLSEWDYTSPHGSTPAGITTPSSKVVATQTNQALYAQNTLALDDATSLTAGARVQHVGFDAFDAENTAAHASKSFTPHAWDLGIRRHLTPAVSVFARVGQSFRIANVDEIYSQYGGPGYTSSVAILLPQTAHDRQAGVDYAQGGTALHADVYEMDLNNEIHYDPNTYANINLSPTRRKGLELAASQKIGPQLTAYANYTYTIAQFRAGVVAGANVSGNDIPMVPRQLANIGAAWAFTPDTRLDGNVQYVGTQRFDNDQSNTFGKMPAWTVASLKLVHETPHWTTSLAVNNLFDRHYYAYGIRSLSTSGAYNVYPADGRSCFVSATYRY